MGWRRQDIAKEIGLYAFHLPRRGIEMKRAWFRISKVMRNMIAKMDEGGDGSAA
jgi:hypothetical protein